MTNEENLNIPQPDPAWDYSPTWDLLYKIKSRIEAALKIMGSNEYAHPGLDKDIKDLLSPASDRLIEIIEQHLNVREDDDDETA